MCERFKRFYCSAVTYLVRVLAVLALVAAAVVAWIGVTLQNGGVLERGLLFAGAAVLLWLGVRLQRRPA